MVARVLYRHCASWQGILQQAQHLKTKAFIILTIFIYHKNLDGHLDYGRCSHSGNSGKAFK